MLSVAADASLHAFTPVIVENSASVVSPPYTPAEVRGAYGIDQVADQGAGQTIAIIDALNDPNIIADANTFSHTFGLVQFNTSGSPSLTVENQDGSTTDLPPDVPMNAPPGQQFDLEESLDVEWAHAAAPDANIILFEANSSSFQDLFAAVTTAANTPGVSTVSMSFGGGEFDGEQTLDNTFLTPAGHSGVTFIASTGDDSFPGGYPAVSPNVLAVGGTSLTINSNNTYGGETAWSGGGGNISDYELQPVFQNAVGPRYNTTQRLTPDVSFLADPNTGVDVLDSYNGGWQQVGGTSLASPMWAGIISIIDQGRQSDGLGTLETSQTHALLYNLPETDFHDITSGSNGYPATTGYDIATGLGTPNVPLLVADMSGRQALFVDSSATGGTSDGLSWTNAYTSLQGALAVATPGTALLVAQGTFAPTNNANPMATFQLQSSVVLLGGYSGVGTDNPDESGAGFTTTLSGAGISDSVVTGSGADSTAVLDGFTISGGVGSGAGMTTNSGSPTVLDCTFTDNLSSAFGGGVADYNSSPTFTNCIFSGDDASRGGGMYNVSSSPTLTNCIFKNNSASFSGGAISFSSASTTTLVNCEFIDNTSGNLGGAAFFFSSSAALINCSFSGNSALLGAAVYSAASNPGITNCILWGDSASTSGNEIYVTSNSGGQIPVITYSDIQGGYAGAANLNADPLFINAAGENLQLQQGSPVIDAGSDAVIPAFLGTDLSGLSRICGTTVDMGAFESQILYVDVKATGSGSGGTWKNALAALATAETLVQWGQTIDAAGGTYTPTSSGDRTATFQLFDNVGIYGGFAGAAAANPYTRNITAYPTILSGDIGAGGDSYHVVSVLTNIPATAVLDGVTITGGNADGSGDDNSSIGGGMLEIGGNPTFNNCIFTANQANGQATAANGQINEGFGAGVFDFTGAPTMTNCTFSDNTTTGQFAFGAGMMDEYASPLLMNCNFTDNSDNGQGNRGGGLFSFTSTETLIDCFFTGNVVNDVGYGGAIFDFTSTPSLTNCVFDANVATGSDPFSAGWGGAIFNFTSSDPVLTNCTFSQNSADLGGAMMNLSSSSATVTNCILYGDTDFFGFEIFVNSDGSDATVTYSDVEGGFTGIGNIDADPLFVSAGGGDLAIQPNSPCVNVGNNAAIEATGVITDIAGNPRIFDGVVDMGAYEAQAVDVFWTGDGDGHDWADPNNWSDQQVPTKNDQVTIGAGFPTIEVAGANYQVATLSSDASLEIQGGASLEFLGSATIDGTVAIDAGAAVSIDSGTFNITQDITGDGTLDIGTVATIARTQLASGGGTSVLAGLNISPRSTLDITSNELEIKFSSAANDPDATIRAYLAAGYAGDTWTGAGITSSNATANPGLYAVGYADGNTDVGTPATANEIFIENTLAGDSNLDGIVNFPDLLVVAQNYGKSGQDWAHGDFNYDNIVNFPDLLLIAQNYGKQLMANQAAPAPLMAAPVLDVAAAPAALSTEPAKTPSLDIEAKLNSGIVDAGPTRFDFVTTQAATTVMSPANITPSAPVVSTMAPAAEINSTVIKSLQITKIHRTKVRTHAVAPGPAVHSVAIFNRKQNIAVLPPATPDDGITGDSLSGVWTTINADTELPFSHGHGRHAIKLR